MAGPSEQEFLKDGVITPAERERAYLNFVSCAAARGVEVYDYSLNPHGGDSFNTRMTGSGERSPDSPETPVGGGGDEPVERPPSQEEIVVNECRSEHYVAVGYLYAYNNRKTGAELAKFNDDVAQCMRDAGVDVPKGATQEQMEQIDHNQFSDCYIEFRDK